MSQEYLTCVAEGRIAARPAVQAVDGSTIRFADGSHAEVDEIICATGYDLELPYLSAEIRRTVQADETHLDLHTHTFHPDLPGLAFIGQFHLIGPHLPVFELQARWVAAVLAGTVSAPSPERMRAGIDEHRAMRQLVPIQTYPALAATLAAELDVEPNPSAYPELAEGLLFGPLAPARYRLEGHGSRPEAEALLRAALSDFGAPPTASARQLKELRMVAEALEDPGLIEIAGRLSSRSAPRAYDLAGARIGENT